MGLIKRGLYNGDCGVLLYLSIWVGSGGDEHMNELMVHGGVYHLS
jgi:hypothetical protein